jgi:hypothetical protein
MMLKSSSPHRSSWFMDPQWCRLTTNQEPWLGPNEIALARTSIKGIPAIITPPWALSTDWRGGGLNHLKRALEESGEALVVIDLPIGETCAWQKPWHVQESHTRILKWNLNETGFEQWPKHRLKQVRKAVSKGITIEHSQNVEEMVQLHQLARQRKSIDSNEDALKQLLHHLLQSPNQSSLIARDANGSSIANAVILHNNGRSIYAFGGQKRSSLSSLATVSLLHKAIEIAAHMGQTSFDFGGSRDPGVDRFYAEFGAQKVTKQRAVFCRAPQRWWLRLLRPDLFD